MNFATKLFVTSFTIFVTVISSIYGGIKVFQSEIKDSSIEVKEEVYDKIKDLRLETGALLKAQDDKVTVQLTAITNDIGEVRKDVRSLLGIARKAQVFVEKPTEPAYTYMEIKKEGKTL